MNSFESPRHPPGTEAAQAEAFLAQSAPAQRSDSSPVESKGTVAAGSLGQDFGNAKGPSAREFTWLHVGLCFVAALGTLLAFALLTANDRTHVWAVAGDVARNLSGIIVVAGAWIAWETNKSRSNEAEKSDFRDRMRWAVENSDHENHLISEYASAVIRSFGGRAGADWMSEEDRLFAQKALEHSTGFKATREERERLLKRHVEEAEAELQATIESSGRPLSTYSTRKLREAEIKRAAHEYEHPYSAAESFVTDLHEIIENHLKETEK